MNQFSELTLENYRCFHQRQKVPLAPLTLLVGENSTGKTSFLAMIRALWDVICRGTEPDFKGEPFDLGSFDEIAHYRGARGGRAETFTAGMRLTEKFDAEVTFGRQGAAPVPVRVRLEKEGTWIEARVRDSQRFEIQLGSYRGEWRIDAQYEDYPWLTAYSALSILDLVGKLLFNWTHESSNQGSRPDIAPVSGSLAYSLEDWYEHWYLVQSRYSIRSGGYWPFASAPVRSKPRRTYDPGRATPDPEGDYVPLYLAHMYREGKEAWAELKENLEAFGDASGLFDEVSIKAWGEATSGPFQVEVRKFGKKLKGPHRNLIDMGYGVSQVLPVLVELYRHNFSRMYLFQQPEVHLHPSAQAALGTLFCRLAGGKRQLVIETHSDHLLDRIRMDVRDRKTALNPSDVSILFFDRRELDVQIHAIRLDEEGNVRAPDNYRKFFMEEVTRSLNL